MTERKKKPPFKLRSTGQMAEELAQVTDEQERLKWFGRVVKDFDKADGLNDLKHYRKNRRHEFDPHWLDEDLDEEVSTPLQFKLNHSHEWLDYIFSRSPDGLHELLGSAAVSKALQSMGSKRKEVLFYRVVHGYSTAETAALLGVSDRNVRKLYDKAIQEVRERLDKHNQRN